MKCVLQIALISILLTCSASAQLWISKGGAVGETLEISVDMTPKPMPLGGAGLSGTPYLIQYGTTPAPAGILVLGTLNNTLTTQHTLAIPDDHNLIGIQFYFKSSMWSSNKWYSHSTCSWIVAPRISQKFVATAHPAGNGLIGASGEARARLADGTILICGGFRANSPPFSIATIYDPGKHTYRYPGNMSRSRVNHVAVPLSDGTALVIGGDYPLPPTLHPAAEIYDAKQSAFLPPINVPYRITNPLAVALRDPVTRKEYVLVAGGSDLSGPSRRALLYDVASRTFSTLPPMVLPRSDAAAVAMQSGSVLITGGISVFGQSRSEVELFLLATRSFHSWGNMIRPRAFHAMVALDGTNALILGGEDTMTNRTYDDLEVFAGLQQRSTALPLRMRIPRSRFLPTRLVNGYYLLTGGTGPGDPARIPEILTPFGTVPLRPIQEQDSRLEFQQVGPDEVVAFDGAFWASSFFRFKF